MRSIESSGKTVEEAVSAGLQQLGLDRLDVRVEVLEEGSKGFFGLFGSKPARVRITERVIEPDFDMDEILRPGASTRVSTVADIEPREEKQEKREKKSQPQEKQNKDNKEQPSEQRKSKPQPKAEKAEVPARQDDKKPPEKETKREATEPGTETPKVQHIKQDKQVTEQHRSRHNANQSNEKRVEEKREPKPRSEKPQREKKPREEMAMPQIPQGPLPDQDVSELSEAGRRARAYLEHVTELMGVSVKIYVAEADGAMSISMMGDTLGILIGRRGDTLDALQYLTSLEVNKGEGDYIRVTLDTENYRAKREESLVRYANRMAARAVKTGHRVVLDPMNPYERRVLHATLQNNEDVETHSEGEEPNRRVVITLKKGNTATGDYDDVRADDGVKPYRNRPYGGRRDGGRPRYNKNRGSKTQNRINGQESSPAILAQDVPDDPEDDTI